MEMELYGSVSLMVDELPKREDDRLTYNDQTARHCSDDWGSCATMTLTKIATATGDYGASGATMTMASIAMLWNAGQRCDGPSDANADDHRGELTVAPLSQ